MQRLWWQRWWFVMRRMAWCMSVQWWAMTTGQLRSDLELMTDDTMCSDWPHFYTPPSPTLATAILNSERHSPIIFKMQILNIQLYLQYNVISWSYAHALVMLDLRKIGGALLTGSIFPYRYTKFETETRPKQGDALLTGGVRISGSIQYHMPFMFFEKWLTFHWWTWNLNERVQHTSSTLFWAPVLLMGNSSVISAIPAMNVCFWSVDVKPSSYHVSSCYQAIGLQAI